MNIKRFFVLLICISVLFFSCKKEEKRNSDDISLANVLVKAKFVVGVDISHPPLSYLDENGELVGFDIDVLRAVADSLDIDIEFVPIEWVDKLELLKKNKIDCVASGFSLTEERKKNYEMTQPYFKNAQIILVLKEKGYKDIKDLKGKTIVGQANTVGMEVLKNSDKYQNIFREIKEYPSTISGVSDVKNRGADAAITDISTITKILNDNPGVFKIIEEAIASDYYVYAFKKGSYSLRDEIEDVLIELGELGTLEKISRKWFGADVVIIGK